MNETSNLKKKKSNKQEKKNSKFTYGISSADVILLKVY